MSYLARFLTLLLYFSMSVSFAQTNYDENQVPQFIIPDPLTTFEGKSIHTAQDWIDTRKPELLRFFTDQVYGEIPKDIALASYSVLEQDNNALGGKALRRQISLAFKEGHKSLSVTLLLYLPKNSSNAPIFLGYNFYGNHTVTHDPAVLISSAWARNNVDFGIAHNKLTAASRGVSAHSWPIEKIIDAD